MVWQFHRETSGRLAGDPARNLFSDRQNRGWRQKSWNASRIMIFIKKINLINPNLKNPQLGGCHLICSAKNLNHWICKATIQLHSKNTGKQQCSHRLFTAVTTLLSSTVVLTISMCGTKITKQIKRVPSGGRKQGLRRHEKIEKLFGKNQSREKRKLKWQHNSLKPVVVRVRGA